MNLVTLTAATTLAALFPNAERRTDRLALGACIVSLLAVFAATNLAAVPHRLVLATSVAGLLVCLVSSAVVAVTRFRDRRQGS